MSEPIEYNFVIKTPLEIEESYQDRAILKGVFLRLGKATKNRREYQIEEAEQIAQGLIGMPVYFGSIPEEKNRHDRDEKHPVGRVFKTLFNKAENIIEGWVEVWNNSRFPDLVKQIKRGWGFSIGGLAKTLIPSGMVDFMGRAIMKVVGMKPNHLQLLEPQIPRGQEEAVVNDIESIEETFEFDPCPWGACEVKEGETKHLNNISDIITNESELNMSIKNEPVQEVVIGSSDNEKKIVVRKTIKRFITVDDANAYVV